MDKTNFNDRADRLLSTIDLHGLAASLGIAADGRNGRFFCPHCQPGGGKDGDLAISDNGDKERWRCFKCEGHGDAADLVSLALGCNAAAAWAWLSDRYDRSATRPAGSRSTALPTPGPPPPPRRIAQPDRPAAPTPGTHHEILGDFLHRLAPPAGTATATYWAGRGVTLQTLERMGVRHIEPRAITKVHSQMALKHKPAALVAAGLAKVSRDKSKSQRPYPMAYPFEAQRVACCAIPHLVGGKVNAVKIRPLLSKPEIEALGLPRFLVAGPMDHLYNGDAIEGAQEVFIAEGESDTLRLLSEGVTAAGVPGKSWRPEWAEPFRGVRRVIIASDPDSAGQELAAAIVRSLHGICELLHIQSPHGDICESLDHLATGQKGEPMPP